MAVGVENAAVVCCFLTSDYQDSIECKIELQYAEKRLKEIIPCILTDSTTWKPSGWLNSVTGARNCIQFDVTSDEFDIDYFILELICHMHEIPSFTKQVFQGKIDLPTYLYEKMRHEYLRKNHIECCIDSPIQISIEQSYINLVIIKVRDQHEQEKQMHKISHNAAVLGTYENIYGLKTSIDVNDIFETCETREKRVLVFGRAGIGKSTFCQYIAYQWAAGMYWPQYEFLAVIQLRNLTTNEYPQLKNKQTYSLFDIVKTEVFKNDLSEEDEQLLREQFNEKKILWILDGYDEIVQNIPSHLKHVLKKLLDTPHHIVTSRPYLNTLPYKVQLEITGFTDENITQYIFQFFQQLSNELDDPSEKAESLVEFLKLNSSAFGVAHIPVNLELICSIWSDKDSFFTENLTISTLYTKMTEWLCRRYLKSRNNNINTLSNHDIYQECQQELSFLQCLAFEAMKANKLIIQPSLLKTASNETRISLKQHPDILNFGVLKACNRRGFCSQAEPEKDHYFIHLSFQEYFAAQYVVNQLKEPSMNNIIGFIKYQKYNQRYALMFTFVAGLSHENQINSTSKIFWKTIQEEPVDLVGVRHMQLIISCLEATYDHIHSETQTNLLRQIAQIIRCNIHHLRLCEDNRIIQRYLCESLKAAQSVMCHEIISKLLVALLQINDAYTKEQTLSFIAHTSISKLSSELRALIVTCLDDKVNEIRSAACLAVGNLGKEVATKEVLKKLATAVIDENWSVSFNAAEAIKNIGEKAATNEVIDKLMSVVTHENYMIRQNACGIIEEICEKIVAKETVDKLVSALANENEDIRIYICDVLGKIGAKGTRNQVIDRLISALTDQNKSIRRCAYLAFENMGAAAAVKEVIGKLSSALTDKNVVVRMYACRALGEICKTTATKETIDQLVAALTDESEWVRINACRALGNIGDKAGTNEVIDKLLSVLADKNINVGRNACEALENICKKGVTKESIDRLVIGLRDNDKFVRKCMCDVLKSIDEKVATRDIIDKLVSILSDEDEDEDVRKSACSALEYMSEKTATIEVVDTLMALLMHQNIYVKVYARKALRNIGEKATTKEVLDRLATALTHENNTIRKVACYSIGNINENLATPEIIDKLVNVLKEKEPVIRKHACEAIGNFGEKAATKDVIDKLMDVLTDSNAEVRKNACNALGKLGEKVAIKEVIDKLFNVLTDKEIGVRRNAYEALGKICKTTATKEVIDKFVAALRDKDIVIRKNASCALGNIGEKAATYEVMDKLVSVLEDQDDVFEAACCALENIGKNVAITGVTEKILKVLPNKGMRIINHGKSWLTRIVSVCCLEDLNPTYLCRFYLGEKYDDMLQNFSIKQLLETGLQSKNSDWLVIIIHALVLRGGALFLMNENVVVYENKEPIEVRIPDASFREQLQKRLTDQRNRLSLSFPM